MGLLDDYFDGYYSEEMIESQVIIFLIFLFLILFFMLSQCKWASSS